jgi:hypothetical protein
MDAAGPGWSEIAAWYDELRPTPTSCSSPVATRWDEGVDVVVEGEARRDADTATLERRLATAWAEGTARGGSSPTTATPN